MEMFIIVELIFVSILAFLFNVCQKLNKNDWLQKKQRDENFFRTWDHLFPKKKTLYNKS